MVQPYRRSGAAVAWLPWILALVLAAPLVASAQVASDDEGAPAAPLTRDRLGGDWCGFRDSLAQHGVRFDLWSTGFMQAMFQGTGDNGWDLGGRQAEAPSTVCTTAVTPTPSATAWMACPAQDDGILTALGRQAPTETAQAGPGGLVARRARSYSVK